MLALSSVNDDRVGFASAASGGRGLRNLASRARDLGGDCYVLLRIWATVRKCGGPRTDWTDVIRLFLVDDHEIVRRGLRELLESNESTSRWLPRRAKSMGTGRCRCRGW